MYILTLIYNRAERKKHWEKSFTFRKWNRKRASAKSGKSKKKIRTLCYNDGK